MYHTKKTGLIASLDLMISLIFIISILSTILIFTSFDMQSRYQELKSMRIKSIIIQEANSLYNIKIAKTPDQNTYADYRKTGYLDSLKFSKIRQIQKDTEDRYLLSDLRYLDTEPDYRSDNQFCHYRVMIDDLIIKKPKKIWVCAGD